MASLNSKITSLPSSLATISYSAANSLNLLSEVSELAASGELSRMIEAQDAQTDAASANSPSTKPTVTKKSKVTAKHTFKIKAKRATRPYPGTSDEKEYIEGEPTENDVVSGRGGKSNHHPGNRVFLELCLRARSAYRPLPTDDDKRAKAEEIIKYIKDVKGGRFVIKDSDDPRWYLMSYRKTVNKTQQALRDTHIPEWAINGMKTDFPDEYARHLEEQKYKKTIYNKRKQPGEKDELKKAMAGAAPAPSKAEGVLSQPSLAPLAINPFPWGSLNFSSIGSLPSLGSLSGSLAVLGRDPGLSFLNSMGYTSSLGSMAMPSSLPMPRQHDWMHSEYFAEMKPKTTDVSTQGQSAKKR